MNDEAWSRVRSLRARPPLLATEGARRAVFGAALEQSEQLFRAAASVGPAAKPLPLFYALSQAGRAISAAHRETGAWQSHGHGLGIRDGLAQLGGTLVEVRPKRDGSDSLSSVSIGLDSAPLLGQMSIGQLVGALPELRALRALAGGALRVVEVHPEGENPNWLPSLHPARGRIYVAASNEHELRAFLDRYYATEGFQLLTDMTGPANGWSTVTLEWPGRPSLAAMPGTKALRPLHEVALRVDDGFYLVPKLGKSERAPHRLVIWWALLYALSSLARYQPAEWVASLDVDASEIAVDLERALAIAEDVLPALIAEALGSTGGIPRPYLNRAIEDERERLRRELRATPPTDLSAPER